MTGREKRGLRPRTLVSGWFWTGLGLTIALCVTLSLAAAHAADMIGRSVALVMLGVAVILCAMLLSETVLRVDRKGFRTLLRRCIPWADVTRIEVREVTRWGSFTFAPVIDRQPDAAGRPRRVILQGFGEPGRPERLEDLRATLQQYRDAATPPTERTPSTEKPSRPPTARRTPNCTVEACPHRGWVVSIAGRGKPPTPPGRDEAPTRPWRPVTHGTHKDPPP